jgi:hypothetical protein
MKAHHAYSGRIVLLLHELTGRVHGCLVVLFQGANEKIVSNILVFDGIITAICLPKGVFQLSENRICQTIVFILKEILGLFITGLRIVKIFGLLGK